MVCALFVGGVLGVFGCFVLCIVVFVFLVRWCKGLGFWGMFVSFLLCGVLLFLV